MGLFDYLRRFRFGIPGKPGNKLPGCNYETRWRGLGFWKIMTPRSFVQLYVHFIWVTQARTPLIEVRWEDELYACLNQKCSDLRCQILAIGGVEDHVHVLARLHPSIAVADFAKHLKGASSHLINQVIAPEREFKWQRGYGALSVSVSHVKRVQSYIQNQKAHHNNGTTWPTLETSEEYSQDSPTEKLSDQPNPRQRVL